MILNKGWIEQWAKKYDNDESMKKEKLLEEEIFKSIKEIGSPPSYLTQDIILKIAEWKAPRIKGYVTKNDAQFVKDVTQVSLTTKNERLRLEVLREF